ncbi:hypothetical protein MO973_43840 [Paenibacillus sp. TRM 82003]|nr:hypothetical protein [Paenibacillus sp. TRM 82003]
MESMEKKTWVPPTLEVLSVDRTNATGDKVWEFVWDGDFWKRQEMTMIS